jgi:hypothetical protein
MRSLSDSSVNVNEMARLRFLVSYCACRLIINRSEDKNVAVLHEAKRHEGARWSGGITVLILILVTHTGCSA